MQSNLLPFALGRMRIGAQLISEGLVTPEHIAEALEAQMIHGGRLGTNLVEREVLALDTLAEALARQHDMAPALEKHFERRDPDIQRRLEPSAAAEWHAIPLGKIADDRVVVAVSDPLNHEGLDALSFALGYQVVPAIAPELRILYHLELAYGVPRHNRFLRPPPRELGSDSRRRYLTTVEDSAPTAPNQLARVAIRKIQVPTTDVTDLPPQIDSIESGLKTMRRCHSRSRLGHALLQTVRETLCPPITCAMIMTLRNGVASGWRGLAPGGNASVIEGVAMMREHEPEIERALAERRTVAGPAPSDPRYDRLWAALGVSSPDSVAVIPVLLHERPVALLYVAHAGPPEPSITEPLEQLADALGTGFDRLLRAAER